MSTRAGWPPYAHHLEAQLLDAARREHRHARVWRTPRLVARRLAPVLAIAALLMLVVPRLGTNDVERPAIRVAPGVYSARISAADSRRLLQSLGPGASIPEGAFTLRVRLDPRGAVELLPDPDAGIVLPRCTKPAAYGALQEGHTIRFRAREDDCPGRAALLQAAAFRR